MRKIIIIISIILVLAAVGFGVYFGWKNAQTILTPPTDSTPDQNPGAITIPQTPGISATPATDTSKLKTLSDNPVFDYWIFSTSTGNNVFYLSGVGKIFKALDGQDEEITSEPILNLQKIYPSFDGKRVIIKYGDLNSPKFKIFNSETKIFEIFPENIAAANFSPDGKQIAYLGKSGNLIIQTKKIMTISQSDFDLEWILPEKIILTPKPSAFYAASAWVVDTKNKTIVPLVNELSGLMIEWSAD